MLNSKAGPTVAVVLLLKFRNLLGEERSDVRRDQTGGYSVKGRKPLSTDKFPPLMQFLKRTNHNRSTSILQE